MYNEEEEYEKLFAKKGSQINARETQGKSTRATKKRGDQLTEMSPHNKYDRTRISGHE